MDFLDAVSAGHRVLQVGDVAFDIGNIFPFQVIAQVAQAVRSRILVRLLVLRHVFREVGLVLAGANAERGGRHQK